MSDSSGSSASGGGIGFCGLLTIVFIVLKLTEKIDWAWGWVLSPLWLGLALVLGVLAIIGIIFLVIALISKISADLSRKKQAKLS